MTRSVRAVVFHKCCVSRLLFLFPAFGSVSFPENFIWLPSRTKWLASARSCNTLYMGSLYSDQQSVLLIAGQPRTVFHLMFNSIAIERVAAITACISYPYGITTMIYLFVAINIGWLFVWYCFCPREIPLTLFSILKDIAPYFLLVAFVDNRSPLHKWASLICICHLLSK